MLAREWPSAPGASSGPLDTSGNGAPPLLPSRGQAQTRPRAHLRSSRHPQKAHSQHTHRWALGQHPPHLSRELQGKRVCCVLLTQRASLRSSVSTQRGSPHTPKTQTWPRGGLPPSQTPTRATGHKHARGHTCAHTPARGTPTSCPRPADPHAESKAVTRPHPERIPPLGCVQPPGQPGLLSQIPKSPPFLGLSFPPEDLRVLLCFRAVGPGTPPRQMSHQGEAE